MRDLVVPPLIDLVLCAGAALVVGTSSGKDSDAVLRAIRRERLRRPAWTGPLRAVHADLGSMEHRGVMEHAQQVCDDLEIPLTVVRRAKGDLVARIKERMEKLKGTGRPAWPSPSQRYCTSDLKATPIDTLLREYDLVVSVSGIRGEESFARAHKDAVSVRNGITSDIFYDRVPIDGELRKLPLAPEVAWDRWAKVLTQTDLFGGDRKKPRLCLSWHAIHDWTLDEVWAINGTSQAELDVRRAVYAAGNHAEAFAGWPCHPDYVRGYSRISCVFCVMGSLGDLKVGAREYPELLEELIAMETEHGFAFRKGFSIASLRQEVPQC